MPKYKVITPVEHDGERYEPGVVLNISAEIAIALLAVGAISDGKNVPTEVTIEEGITE